MKHPNRYHDPLEPDDTPEKTVGCRHTNASICKNNSMPGVCAFARPDGFCTEPPRSWASQFVKLSAGVEGQGNQS